MAVERALRIVGELISAYQNDPEAALTIPEERRGETEQVVYGLIAGSLCAEFEESRLAVFKDAGILREVLRREVIELPVDDMLRQGLGVLTGEQLAELLFEPDALRTFHELVLEALEDQEEITEAWLRR